MKHPKFLVCLLRPFSTPWEEPGRTPLTSRSRTSSTKSTTGPGPSMWTTSSWSWGSPVEISTARSISRMLSEPSARIKMVPCFIFHIQLLHFYIFCLNSKHNSHIRLYSCCRTEVCNESSSRTGRYSFWDAYLVSVPFSQFLLVSNQCYKHYKSDRIAFPGLSGIWPCFHSSNESPFHFVEVPLGEIDEMISTVDKNKDGKISYSEFR